MTFATLIRSRLFVSPFGLHRRTGAVCPEPSRGSGAMFKNRICIPEARHRNSAAPLNGGSRSRYFSINGTSLNALRYRDPKRAGFRITRSNHPR